MSTSSTTQFPDGFLWGAATAAHQIEGNNTNSDRWTVETQPNSSIKEPSGDACDSLHRWREDLDLVASMGLNTYRFSIEWARIEPAQGMVSSAMLGHYRRIIEGCFERGITPVVTLHHFTLPKWVARLGGWFSEESPALFAQYVKAVRPILDGVEWVCIINEPNMVALVTAVIRGRGAVTFDTAVPEPTVTARLIDAHHAARAELAGHSTVKTGWTVANQDAQALDEDGTANAEAWTWQREDQYLEVCAEDDFIGVQAYSRQIIGKDGWVAPGPDSRRTTTDWEFYPAALGHAVRHTADVLPGVPILVTENGISTKSDDDRIEYIRDALIGLHGALADGVDVRGYLHWSLLDNYEWGSYGPTFGLVAVDRQTFERTLKPSGQWYGQVAAAQGLPN